MKLIIIACTNFYKYFKNYIPVGIIISIFYIVLFLLFSGFAGIEKDVKQNFKSMFIKDIAIGKISRDDSGEYSDIIDDKPEIKKIIESSLFNDGEKKVHFRLVRNFKMSAAGLSSNVSVIGLDIKGENDLRSNIKLIEGSWDDLDTELPSLIIGYKLSEKFDIKAGSFINLIGKTVTGQYQSDYFKVAGIIKDTGGFYNDIAFSNITAIHAFLESPDSVNQVLIEFSKKQDIESKKRVIMNILKANNYKMLTSSSDGFYVYSLKDYSYIFNGIISLFLICLVLIIILLTLLIFSGIMGNFTFIIYKRIKEIEIMISIGIPKAKIAALLFYEGLGFCIVFSSFALLSSLILITFLYNSGVKVTNQALTYLFGLSEIRFDLNILYFIFPFLIILFIISISYILLIKNILNKEKVKDLKKVF